MKVISLFNHKGGVSKTTTTFHLGWALSQMGNKKVLVVDADPRCNLTGLILDFVSPDAFDNFYEENPDRNLMSGLRPAFEARPELIKAIEPLAVPGNDRLYVLPGHLNLGEYESTLNIAQELSTTLPTFQNVPGAINALIQATAVSYNFDYILVDLNPSFSALNKNFLMTSDLFIVPCSPDAFSVMALNSLSHALPNWADWYQRVVQQPQIVKSSYPLPDRKPKLLGITVNQYRPKKGEAPQGVQRWIDKVVKTTSEVLVDNLSRSGMAFSAEDYALCGFEQTAVLAQVPNFNSLISFSQDTRKPVFEIQQSDTAQGGNVWDATKKNIELFRDLFFRMQERVQCLAAKS